MAERSEELEESRPPTSESNFDAAFLQTQTKKWVGEVLNKRFDETTEISDLLADGVILHELYQAFQKILADGEENSHKTLEQELAAFRDIIEKDPYPNVECFIKICQVLGVEDSDLFTSSDIINKTNTRKVCLCLRSLSKAASMKKLNVPDFETDNYLISRPVTVSVPVPTDVVENHRSDVEGSTSSFITSSDQDKNGESNEKDRQVEPKKGLGSEAINPNSDTSCSGGVDLNSNEEAEPIGTSTSLYGEDIFSTENSGSQLASTLCSDNSGPEPEYQGQQKHVSTHATDTTLPSLAESVVPLDRADESLVVADVVETITEEISGEMKPDDSSSQSIEKESKVSEQYGENDSSSISTTENIGGEDASSSAVECKLSDDANGLDAATVEVNSVDDHPSSMKSPEGRNDLEGDNTGCKQDLSCENEENMKDEDALGGSKSQIILQEKNIDQNLQVPVSDDMIAGTLLSNEHLGMSVGGSSENLDEGHQVDSDCRDIPCTHDVKMMYDPSSVQSTENMDKEEIKPEDDEKVKARSQPQSEIMMSLVIKGAGMAAIVGLGISLFCLRAKGRSETEGNKSSESRKKATVDNHSSNHVHEKVEANDVYPSHRLRL